MGLTSPFFNLFYALNPFPESNYQTKATEDLPSLPDLTQQLGDYNIFGVRNIKNDPRFSFSTHDTIKKCMYNFAVWRQCLLEKSGPGLDEEDANASICKKYKTLAKGTCAIGEWKRYTDQVERDAFMGLFGLNFQVQGTNPNILFIDDHYNVVKVFNEYQNGKRKYYAGESLL